MMNFSLLLTLYAGFTHAFETDHLLAVSNIVTNRNKTTKAVKDGLFWGLGHTSTIIIIGVFMLLLKFNISEKYFRWFEAGVGIMLLTLGIYRLYKWYKEKRVQLHTLTHTHTSGKGSYEHTHLPAYNIGLVHGLAGSGSLIILVMSKSQSVSYGLAYLLIFGIGSVVGMMMAAGAFSLPFSQKIFTSKPIQAILIFSSAIVCILYGCWVFYKNVN